MDRGQIHMKTLCPDQLAVPETPWNDERAHLRLARKVKAPFHLTRMSACHVPPMLWLWSRRGRAWVVGQELSLDPVPIGE